MDLLICPECERIQTREQVEAMRRQQASCCGSVARKQDAPGVIRLLIERNCPCQGMSGPWDYWGEWDGRSGVRAINCGTCGFMEFDPGPPQGTRDLRRRS